VMSVDLSVAVDANARNFPITDNHRIAKADLTRLPFAPRQFDVKLPMALEHKQQFVARDSGGARCEVQRITVLL